MNESIWSETLSQINKDIKKENKSLRNRLQSIRYDCGFLETEVMKRFPKYPVIPNERCGVWYCNPKNFTQTSYFKSTDGHTSQWDFSTRRLNFHLFPTLQEHGGIVIVDSTRRGKKIPDALSKTVPIWCAVLNYVMLKSKGKEINIDEILFVPPATVSKTEYSSIAKKLPELVEKLENLGVIDGRELFDRFGGKILRPIWVFPGSSILRASVDPFTGETTQTEWAPSENDNIIPLILCTVSYQAQDGMDKRNGFTYVQGAADDHELWSNGLDAGMFWDNYDYLTDPDKTDAQLEEFVDQLIVDKKLKNASLTDTLDDVFESRDDITTELSLGEIRPNLEINDALYDAMTKEYRLCVILSDNVTLKLEKKEENDSVKIYKLQSGSKKSSKELRTQIAQIFDTIQEQLIKSKGRVLICCNTGTDMSVGVLLAVLCKDYSMEWKFEPDVEHAITKTVVKKHLSRLITSLKGRNVNPSRATLNSINSFLM